MTGPAEKPKPTAIVIDDESHVRTILRELLVDLGCEVLGEATTGLEGVRLFQDHHPDITMLDITLPHMSGEEVLMMIMPENPDAVVIVLTSMTDERTVDECLDLGACNYIRKDTPLAEIRKIIKDTLDLYYGD